MDNVAPCELDVEAPYCPADKHLLSPVLSMNSYGTGNITTCYEFWLVFKLDEFPWFHSHTYHVGNYPDLGR